ncbi:hypothetical protein NC651_009578 [Populus alba x Populus x berolinensis]|nr:hypothetical protein NC651_009578 [Populus alba x Populus x berolinensis]
MMRTKISSKGNISRELAASEFPETRLVRGVFAAISFHQAITTLKLKLLDQFQFQFLRTSLFGEQPLGSG